MDPLMTPMRGKVKNLWLMGRLWEVSFVGRNCVVLDDDGKAAHGVCVASRQYISLSSDDARDVQRQTLIHEIRHAFDAMANGGHSEEVEQCVRASESGWYQFWRDTRNRWAWDFIQEGVKRHATRKSVPKVLPPKA